MLPKISVKTHLAFIESFSYTQFSQTVIMPKLNAHQVLKDHTAKQFHDISATEVFLQIEREVATEGMKEGSGQWDTWS